MRSRKRPISSAPTIEMRSSSRSPTTTRQPSFSPPSRCVAGMRTSSNSTSLKLCAKAMFGSGWMETPGVFMSSRNIESPRCLGALGSVRASTNIASAKCAPEVQILWPLSTNSSPSRSARVCSDARSEPEDGSESPSLISISASSMPGTYCCCSASDPWFATISARKVRTGGASTSSSSCARMNCCSPLSSAPPRSFASCGTIQPRERSASRHASAASRRAGSSPRRSLWYSRLAPRVGGRRRSFRSSSR